MPNLAAIVKRIFLKQDLLYWEKVGESDKGLPILADTPLPLKCRWEDRVQEILTPQGRKAISHAYLLMIDKLVIGSLIFQGTMADWQATSTYPAKPTFGQGGNEVLHTDTTPDVKNKSTIYEVYL